MSSLCPVYFSSVRPITLRLPVHNTGHPVSTDPYSRPVKSSSCRHSSRTRKTNYAFIACPAVGKSSIILSKLPLGGHFEGSTRGNVVPIVEKLTERTGIIIIIIIIIIRNLYSAIMPLGGYRGAPVVLKCLRTHNGRHCEPLSVHKCTTDCRILHIQAKHFPGVISPGTAAGMDGLHPPACTPSTSKGRHQSPLGSPAFPLFLFYETTTARGKRGAPPQQIVSFFGSSATSAIFPDEKYRRCHGDDDNELVKSDEAESEERLWPGDRGGRSQSSVHQRHADGEPDGVLPLSNAPVRPATSPINDRFSRR